MRWRVAVALLLLSVATVARAEKQEKEKAKHERRIAAIGDLHGDLAAARAALKLAGAIDDRGKWIGGDLVVVQDGDELDRGDGEREILDLFDRLAGEAAAAGGQVVAINGNHEVMNVQGDFRYVTPGGFAAWGGEKGRRAAFAPGGPEARRLARRPIYARVGDVLFAHGGILPEHVRLGLDDLDRATRAWMEGRAPGPPPELVAAESPIWTRRYGNDPADCDALAKVLEQTGARAMVVAHTTQERGTTSACDRRLWRIDVGLAALYGGPIEVLVIEGKDIRVLHADRAKALP